MPLVKSEIQNDLRKLRKSLKRAPKNLTPEEVHKLRTRARRILALIAARSLPSLDRAKLTKPLKRIRKRTGRVRDMDVLTSHLAALHSDTDASCRIQLLECLGAKRYRRADRLQSLLKKQGSDLRKGLRRVVKSVAKETRSKRGKSASKHSAQVLELTAGLGEPVQLTKANLHPYRLKVKELRDALRMAGGAQDSRFAEELARSKDAIGEWHDWEELIAIADKILGHGPQCPLLQELKAISRQKFDSALAIAEKLRTDYARAETGKGKRARTQPVVGKARQQTPLPPVPERALKAVAGVVQ